MGECSREMPKYQCHKKVWALKIKEVLIQAANEHFLVPEEEGYGRFAVSEEYVQKHKPEAGGYYVVYPGGYESFSPSKAFEDGYSRV